MKRNKPNKKLIICLIVCSIIFVLYTLACFYEGYKIGKSNPEIIEKEVIKYIEVEKNVDNTDVTAETVDNFIDEVESVTQIDYYPLTEQEYIELCEVVMAEAGGECCEGQMAVAQCILNACLKEDIRPTEVFTLYKYTPTRKMPSESVETAVNAVFKNGEKVTEEEILYFYAPKYARGTWHETQRFVLEIGGHRFFALK